MCFINKLAISFPLYMSVSCLNSSPVSEARTEEQAGTGGEGLTRLAPGDSMTIRNTAVHSAEEHR